MKKFFALLLILSAMNSVYGKVKLPAVFSDYMVLQQKTNAAVWGQAAPGKTIELSNTWSRKRYTVKADEAGNWKIMVATPSYGGPYAMTISDGEPLVLMNIMIGEVWICSGQSNMEFPMSGWTKVVNAEKEIADAKYPNIRLLQVKQQNSNVPLTDVKVTHEGWTPCIPQFIPEFSAVAYFFAREIYKKTGIPIGLIHTSWGGTVIEAWTSANTMRTMPDFAAALVKVQEAAKVDTIDYTREKANRPTALYNAMINPFIQYSIRGAIWYQGENNAPRAHQYRMLFPALIKDWRAQWKLGDFPFYFVQLANYALGDGTEFAWAELRDAQLQTLILPNTGMAVTIDVGEAGDIHPKNKQDVGKRLALIALANTYGKNIAYSGPLLKSYKVLGDKIKLKFDHTDGGLVAKGGKELTGFRIAGKDQKFYPAKAVLKGNHVELSSSDVSEPMVVRYAWANNPICNLYNGAGLPASPFTITIMPIR